ncbi:extracellular serine proteinase-like [Diadema setosum]|uniref:extracellular serine proteinase-like n=1 Tax=Diadema setosum TaxID=31175 RepID=UPI003B3BC629
MKQILIALLLVAAASAKPAPLFSQDERIPGRYIVKLKPGWDREKIISNLRDSEVFYKYTKVFSGFAAQLSDEMLDFLRASEAVEYIEEDGVVTADYIPSWGLDRVDQISLPLDDKYEPIGTGNSSNVYVIDTGINTAHVDFGGRASIGYDALGSDGQDCNGHGTHCAGTVGGTEFGVAKEVNLIAVRVLNCFGGGTTSGMIDGCEWVANNHVHPAVVSMSLGIAGSQAMDDAIDAMYNAGVTVVVSAGNNNFESCLKSPARATTSISVGATDSADVRASFSNYGECVDIFAPGVLITSTWIDGTDEWDTLSGTSMACPHVAGAAAILRDMNPTLTPGQVKVELQERAIEGAVQDAKEGSPNLLLYIGQGTGGGSGNIPPTRDPDSLPDPLCNVEFSDGSGRFYSPGYPLGYENNLDCEYLFTTTSPNVVALTFNDFGLEAQAACDYDFVSIYDGNSSSASLMGTWCGTDSPGIVQSTGSSLFMRFVTDFSIDVVGFFVNYDMWEVGNCDSNFTSERGYFMSPEYPFKYENNYDCSSTITTTPGTKITISFLSMDLERHTECEYDYVEIHDGDSTAATSLGKVCGDVIPEPITSTGNAMTVHFHTDSSVTRTGFRASYTAE